MTTAAKKLPARGTEKCRSTRVPVVKARATGTRGARRTVSASDGPGSGAPRLVDTIASAGIAACAPSPYPLPLGGESRVRGRKRQRRSPQQPLHCVLGGVGGVREGQLLRGLRGGVRRL